MKKLAIILIGSLSSLSSLAVGANWSWDIEGVTGDIYKVDLESIKSRPYNLKTITGYWVRANYANNDKNCIIDGKYCRAAKYYQWVDCKEKTISNPTTTVYYDISGNVLKSYSSPIIEFREIVPESISENTFNTACSAAMWKEYDAIPSVNGVKDLSKIELLGNKYPYQKQLLDK